MVIYTEPGLRNLESMLNLKGCEVSKYYYYIVVCTESSLRSVTIQLSTLSLVRCLMYSKMSDLSNERVWFCNNTGNDV